MTFLNLQTSWWKVGLSLNLTPTQRCHFFERHFDEEVTTAIQLMKPSCLTKILGPNRFESWRQTKNTSWNNEKRLAVFGKAASKGWENYRSGFDRWTLSLHIHNGMSPVFPSYSPGETVTPFGCDPGFLPEISNRPTSSWHQKP